MAFSIRRAKISELSSVALATSGFLLAPPQWSTLGIALPSGILCGVIFIAAIKSKEKYAGTLALIPLIVGSLICQKAFSPKMEWRIGVGDSLQFMGVAGTIGFGLIIIYLLKKK